MQDFSIAPREIFHSVFRNRGLLYNLVYREVVGRYKGSVLGMFWSLVTPVLMLFIYTFVFSFVFKARWDANTESRTEFALILFAGLLVFNFFSECIIRAPGLVTGNANYVKKVVFPLEILPWVTLGCALFHFCISLIVWVVAYCILVGVPHETILFTPLIILPFAIFIMGVSWLLASLGVYLRDVGQVIGIGVTMLMFVSPIFYPASALPDKYRIFIYLNPLTTPIEMMRDAMYWGKLPNPTDWVVALIVSFVVAAIGFAGFQMTRKGFADVI